jgi:hypothetical protein
MFPFILLVLAVVLTLVASAVTVTCLLGGVYLLALLSFIHSCAGLLMVSVMLTHLTWRR